MAHSVGFLGNRGKQLTFVLPEELLHQLVALDVLAAAPLPAPPRLAVRAQPLLLRRLVVGRQPRQPAPRHLRHGHVARARLVAEVDLLQLARLGRRQRGEQRRARRASRLLSRSSSSGGLSAVRQRSLLGGVPPSQL